MIVLVVVLVIVFAPVLAVLFVRGATRRPWWEETLDDLDSLPTTEEDRPDHPDGPLSR